MEVHSIYVITGRVQVFVCVLKKSGCSTVLSTIPLRKDQKMNAKMGSFRQSEHDFLQLVAKQRITIYDGTTWDFYDISNKQQKKHPNLQKQLLNNAMQSV